MQDDVQDPTPTAYAYPLLIKQLLHTPFVQAPDQEIVYRGQIRMTYATLHERIARLANGLSRLGARHGSTVAVMDWDSHRYLERYVAVPMMGAVLQTVNVRLSQAEIAYPTIRLILLTLVRKSELIEATWDKVDFENATWTIPKQRMKGRNPHVVYLSRQAVDIFIALHTCAAGSKFILPSRYDADRCMSKATLNRGHAARRGAGESCRVAAGAVHRPRPAPYGLDAVERDGLQRRLDREVPGP